MEAEPVAMDEAPATAPAPEIQPAAATKRVLTDAQLEILKKAREKAVEARKLKADAKKAEKGLQTKEAELKRLEVVLKTEELEKKLQEAKAPQAPVPAPQPAAQEKRGKRRPNAPTAKRVRFAPEEESDAMEEGDWDEWEEDEPQQPPPRGMRQQQLQPRYSSAYHAPPAVYHAPAPSHNAFDMHAQHAYAAKIDQMKRELIYRSVWGNR